MKKLIFVFCFLFLSTFVGAELVEPPYKLKVTIVYESVYPNQINDIINTLEDVCEDANDFTYVMRKIKPERINKQWDETLTK